MFLFRLIYALLVRAPEVMGRAQKKTKQKSKITYRYSVDNGARISTARSIVHAFVIVDTPITIPFALNTCAARVVSRTIEKCKRLRHEIFLCFGTAHA